MSQQPAPPLYAARAISQHDDPTNVLRPLQKLPQGRGGTREGTLAGPPCAEYVGAPIGPDASNCCEPYSDEMMPVKRLTRVDDNRGPTERTSGDTTTRLSLVEMGMEAGGHECLRPNKHAEQLQPHASPNK